MLKKELRKKYKDLRKELSHKERATLSHLILERLTDNFKLEGKTVSVFLPIERFSEIITWPLMDDPGYVKVLPVIDSEGGLKHLKYIGKEQIKVTDWGIPEPQFGEAYQSNEVDLVIVPMLAMNDKGYRVGYGKGFYDGFLKSCRPDCVFVGVSYYDQFEEIDDLHDNDIPLNFLVTPNKIYSF